MFAIVLRFRRVVFLSQREYGVCTSVHTSSQLENHNFVRILVYMYRMRFIYNWQELRFKVGLTFEISKSAFLSHKCRSPPPHVLHWKAVRFQNKSAREIWISNWFLILRFIYMTLRLVQKNYTGGVIWILHWITYTRPFSHNFIAIILWTKITRTRGMTDDSRLQSFADYLVVWYSKRRGNVEPVL